MRRIRPPGHCLEDVRSLLDVLEKIPEPGGPEPGTDESTHAELVARLRKFWLETDARREDPRREPAAEGHFARSLHGHPARLTTRGPAAPAAPADGGAR